MLGLVGVAAGKFMPAAELEALSYPIPPWIQRGNAWVFETEVPVHAAQQMVPSQFNITATSDGVTKGAVYIAKYSEKSTVAYSEAIFICAAVTYKGQKGNWIGNIFVDSTAAQQAGREVWGMPKQMAKFEWSSTKVGPFGLGHVEQVKITAAGALIGYFNFTDTSIPIPFMHQITETFSLRIKQGRCSTAVRCKSMT